jgi:hypothetical protein
VYTEFNKDHYKYVTHPRAFHAFFAPAARFLPRAATHVGEMHQHFEGGWS